VVVACGSGQEERETKGERVAAEDGEGIIPRVIGAIYMNANTWAKFPMLGFFGPVFAYAAKLRSSLTGNGDEY
jgi:hypothetical protein